MDTLYYQITRPSRGVMHQHCTLVLSRSATAVQRVLLPGMIACSIVAAIPSVLADDEVTLPPLMVQGDKVQAYSGGQVTTRGRIGLLGDKDFMDTPFNTISYTEKFMADQQAKDISEVISKTDPTVFMSGIPGESNESYSIRGFRSAVGDVTVNGLAGMAGYYRSSPEMFERVEVLKGPSALLNGMPPKGSVGGREYAG